MNDMLSLYKKYYYPAEARFYKLLKENNVNATHSEVKDFISK